MKRRALILTAIGLLAAPAAATAARAAGAVLVMNSGAASLSVIDMATQKELRRIPVKLPNGWGGMDEVGSAAAFGGDMRCAILRRTSPAAR